MVLNGETLRIKSNKLKGIKEWPCTLKNVKQLHSMLGVLGYQHPFIPGFALLMHPLMCLLKKGVEFTWTDECTVALDKLINIVTSDPILWQPRQQEPFKLEVDASQVATGAVLWQYDVQGQQCPIRYDSKTFNEAECNYPIWDREFLAIV